MTVSAASAVARETLVMLVSPLDRHHDAHMLSRAGYRVITTSRMQSTASQVLRATPAAIAIELVSAFAADTFDFAAALAEASRARSIPVVIYGSHVDEAGLAAMRSIGAIWVAVSATDRSKLAVAICDALPA